MSEQVIRQVGKTRNVVGYTLWWLKFINYHLLSKNGVVVSRSHSCYWPFQPLGLLIWTLRLGLVMKQIQQEQAPLKYNQTIPWDKTQTEVSIHYHECQRKLYNCKIFLRFRNKRTISHCWPKQRGILPRKHIGKGQEKSLRHVAMVAKFLNDNKPKTSLKKRIRTVSNFIGLIQFHLICQNVCKIFWGWIPKDSI